MNNRVRPWTALLLLAFSTTAHGSDLLEHASAALEQDPGFEAARATQEGSSEQVRQAWAALMPQVSATGARTRVSLRSSPFDLGDSTGYSLSLQQSLFDLADYHRIGEARRGRDAADAQLDSARQNLLLDVATDYLDLLLALENLEVTHAEREAIKAQMARAQQSFDVGNASITDLDEARARLDLVLAREIGDRDSVEIARRRLELRSGLGGDLPAGTAKGLETVAADLGTAEEWIARASRGNPDLAALRDQAGGAGKKAAAARSERLPSVDLIAMHIDSDGGGIPGDLSSSGDFEGDLAMLRVTVPVFTGGLLSSRIREAEANARRADARAREAEQQTEILVRNAWLSTVSGRARVRALESALASAQKALDSTRLAVEVGLRTSVDLLNAEQQVFATRRDLRSAQFLLLLSRMQLEAAVGDLDLVDVRHINDILHGSRS